MTGEILLKMVSVLTPDDVRQLKAAGCGGDVREWLATFDRMAAAWRLAGISDSQVWADIQVKLTELRAALRVPEDKRLELERQAEVDAPKFLRDRERRG